MLQFLKDNENVLKRTITPSINMRLIEFFYVMMEPDITKRRSDIINYPSEYKELLKNMAIWVIDTPKPSEMSIQIQNKTSDSYVLNKKEKTALRTAIQWRKECKENYERDEETKKCLKKCKPGQKRNKMTKRCRKITKNSGSRNTLKNK